MEAVDQASAVVNQSSGLGELALIVIAIVAVLFWCNS